MRLFALYGPKNRHLEGGKRVDFLGYYVT